MARGEFISVVIPAYNEAGRITPTVGKIWAYLGKGGAFRDFEIIIVNDGSIDRTSAIAEELSAELGKIKHIHIGRNSGKGNAVRQGVLAAKGGLVLMSDADLSTPIEEIAKLHAALNEGYDIAIGSRALKESEVKVRQPWHREMMGRTFNLFVRSLVVGGFSDTQCGFKLFRAEAAKRIFGKSRIKGFSFDVEAITIALGMGYKVKEVPVEWRNSASSRVSVLRDPADMFLDLLKIRFNKMLGLYT